MTVGKSTAHLDHLALCLEIRQGVPNANFSPTEWADQRMKTVNKAIKEQSQLYLTYLTRKQYI